MINRTAAPPFRQVERIELLNPQEHVMSNGMKLFTIDGGEQGLVRIEFIFGNVAFDRNRPLQTFATNSMLIEGTDDYSSSEIADAIDYYGAFLQTEYNNDHSALVLFTLNRHLDSILPILRSVITSARFPEEELQTFIANQKQKLSVSLEKNDFLARRKFNHLLFGDSLYGVEIGDGHYDELNREDLLDYYKKAYTPANCTVIVAGKISESVVRAVEDHFGGSWGSGLQPAPNTFQFTEVPGASEICEKADALQSAIRLGGFAINRQHSDFPGLQVLNTILGGYFGSRLMRNIREDKGYTYGIGSAVGSLKNAGYFFIASEVGKEVRQATLDEIRSEITILKSKAIDPAELDLVRNFMLGSMLGSLENAMSHADKFKNVYFFGLDYDYYNRYIRVVHSISPEEIMRLANVYLDFDKMAKVIVG